MPTSSTPGATAGGPIDVFSVFDSLTVPAHGLGNAVNHGPSHGLSLPGASTQAASVTTWAQPQTRVIPAAAIAPSTTSSTGLTALDFALADADTASVVNPRAASLQVVQTSSKGSTINVVKTSTPPVIDPAAVDALLFEGLSVRSRQIADRPGQPLRWSI